MQKGIYITDQELFAKNTFAHAAAYNIFYNSNPDTIVVGWIIECDEQGNILRVRRPILQGEKEKMQRAVTGWFFNGLPEGVYDPGFFDDLLEVMHAHGCNVPFRSSGERSL